jgi:glycerophosphoryl diester phosphodiesterase
MKVRPQMPKTGRFHTALVRSGLYERAAAQSTNARSQASKFENLAASGAESSSNIRNAHFLIQIKDADPRIGEIMVRYLEERKLAQWDRLAFFGSKGPLLRLKALQPEAHTWSVSSIARCFVQYRAFGWTGHVPNVCDNGMIIVSISQTRLLWGWPDRFLIRMRDHGTDVMLIGRVQNPQEANFTRLNTLKELAQVPPGFTGSIWTDRIDIIGPALQKQRSQLTGARDD